MRCQATSVRSVVVVAMVGIFVAIALTTSMGASAASYTTASYSARLLALVNAARQQHGEQPLTLVPGITEVAAAWTEHLAAAQVLSHNPRLARDLSTHGSRSWLTYGENVGMGSTEDPDGLFEAYMRSPEHRANILGNDYRYVGVAAVFTSSRAWNTFDFVDVYRTAPGQPAKRPMAHAIAPHQVAAKAATVKTPPVRPSRRAARPAGPVVVHVKAVRQQVVRPPIARFATESVATLPAAFVAPHGHRTGSRQPLVAAAVVCLVFGSRRWLLVAARRS